MRAIVLSALLFAAAPAAGPLRFSVDAAGKTQATITVSGAAAELPPGLFRGTVTVNGSAAELPVSGTVAHSAGKFVLPVVVPYAQLPSAWAEGFRQDAFTYRLRGAVGGAAPREWTGTQAFRDVEFAGGSSEDFLALQNVRLTEMSLTSSEGVGELSIYNPLSFELRIASADYVLFADGELIGEGSARGMILHPGRKTVLNLPIVVDHAALLSAAGQALLSGGDVAVRLSGKLVLRLKGGDVVIPLDLSGRLTDAS